MSVTEIAVNAPVLEPAAQAFAEATSHRPFLFELPPDEGREAVDAVQSGAIDGLPIDEEWISLPTPAGDVRVRIIKPARTSETLPVVLYVHGAGWVFGDARTHDRVVR